MPELHNGVTETVYLEKLVIDNIRRIRREKGISQKRLAEACNTATSYIGHIETYKTVPRLSTVQRIAEALGVDPVMLFYPKGQEFSAKNTDWLVEKGQVLSLLTSAVRIMQK
jgi:transcriptional regulator with XRE-family HTH domain